MMKRLIIIAGLTAATLNGYAQTEVMAGLSNGKDYGVTYALPKTEIEVRAKVCHVVYTPGEFAKYANRYLRINDVPQEAEEHYELLSLSAASVGVADKDNSYFIKMKDKTVAPLVELTKDGLIKSINMPRSSETTTASPTKTTATKSVDPRSFLTEEILMTSSSAKMAELVAKEIYSIRESKNALLRGQADNMPKDGEQLRIMIESLNEQEQAMTEMFTGKYVRTEKDVNVRIEPEGDVKDAVALRFSKKLGVVSTSNLAGEPVYITISDLNSVTKAEENSKKKPEGVAYNVPGKALVTLTMNNAKVYEQELPVTQFGNVEYLASVLFNKNSTIKVSFDSNTGAILKIDRETTGN
jgi:hypothetical protein